MPTAFEIQQQIDEEKRRIAELKAKIAAAKAVALANTDPLAQGVGAVEKAIGGQYAPATRTPGSALAETVGLFSPKAKKVVERIEGGFNPNTSGTVSGVVGNIGRDARYLIPGFAGAEFGIRGGAEIGKAIGEQMFSPDQEKVLPSQRGGAPAPKTKGVSGAVNEQAESLGRGLSMPITAAIDWARALGIDPSSGGFNPILEMIKGESVDSVMKKYPEFAEANRHLQENPLLSSLVPVGVAQGIRTAAKPKSVIESHAEGYQPRTKAALEADKKFDDFYKSEESNRAAWDSYLREREALGESIKSEKLAEAQRGIVSEQARQKSFDEYVAKRETIGRELSAERSAQLWEEWITQNDANTAWDRYQLERGVIGDRIARERFLDQMESTKKLPPPPDKGEGFSMKSRQMRDKVLPNERTTFFERESGEFRGPYPESIKDHGNQAIRQDKIVRQPSFSQPPIPPERFVGRGGVDPSQVVQPDFIRKPPSVPNAETTIPIPDAWKRKSQARPATTDPSVIKAPYAWQNRKPTTAPVVQDPSIIKSPYAWKRGKAAPEKTAKDVQAEATTETTKPPRELSLNGIDPENPFSGVVELQGGFGFTKDMFDKVVETARAITPDIIKRTSTRFESPRGKEAWRMVDTAINRSKNVTGDLKEDARLAGMYKPFGKKAEALGHALSDGTAPPEMKAVYDKAWLAADQALGGTLGKVTEYFPRRLKDSIAEKVRDETMTIRQKNAALFQDGVDPAQLSGLLQKLQANGKVSPALTSMIQSNLKSGLAKDMAQAFVMAERDSHKHMIGRRGWEHTRTAQYEDNLYEWNMSKVTDNYLTSLGHRVAEAEMFGANGENYVKAYNTLKTTAPAEAELFKKMVSSFTGHWNLTNPPGKFRKAAELTNRISLVPKLGLSSAAVPNFFQVAISGFSDFGAKSTGSAIARFFFDKKSREANRRIGALEGSLRDVFDASSRPGAIADAMMAPFNIPNAFQQHLHANIAREQIPKLYEKARSDVQGGWRLGEREIARDQLREYFGIDHNAPLTEKIINESAVKYADNSQLISRVTSDPLMFHDPNVRWAFFLKRFGPKRFMQFKDQLTWEWQNGNAPELNKMWYLLKKGSRLGAGSLLAGEATIATKDLISQAVTGQPQTRTDEDTMKRIINDLAASATAGIITDFIGVDDKEWWLDVQATPVAIDTWLKFADASFRMADDMQKYSKVDALRRGVKPFTRIAGGVIGQIGQTAQTPGQRQDQVEFRFGQTRTKIFEALKNGDDERAARLQMAWDEENPNRPMLSKDISWGEYNQWLKGKDKRRANP